MGMVQEQFAFLLDVSKLINEAARQGFEVTGGELWRTPEQQKVYFETGKSKTMASKHLQRLAIDFNFFKNGALIGDKATIEPLGIFWEGLNVKNRWGGHFSTITDCPHFERNV